MSTATITGTTITETIPNATITDGKKYMREIFATNLLNYQKAIGGEG